MAAFTGIADLELSLNPRVCDASVPALAACTALTRLDLASCAITDAALPQLAAALPRLASLSLSGCQVRLSDDVQSTLQISPSAIDLGSSIADWRSYVLAPPAFLRFGGSNRHFVLCNCLAARQPGRRAQTIAHQGTHDSWLRKRNCAGAAL